MKFDNSAKETQRHSPHPRFLSLRHLIVDSFCASLDLLLAHLRVHAFYRYFLHWLTSYLSFRLIGQCQDRELALILPELFGCQVGVQPLYIITSQRYPGAILVRIEIVRFIDLAGCLWDKLRDPTFLHEPISLRFRKTGIRSRLHQAVTAPQRQRPDHQAQYPGTFKARKNAIYTNQYNTIRAYWLRSYGFDVVYLDQ